MTELLDAAVELMLLGMGTVFVFLVLLILATRLMSTLVLSSERNNHHEVEASLPNPIPVVKSDPAQDGKLIKVIAEAIKQHRNS